MQLSSYLLLVGAAVLVTHFSGTDSYTIGRSSSSKIEDHESKETSADNDEHNPARMNQTSTEFNSNEDDDDDDTVVEDSSEEEELNNMVKRSAQFSTRNSDEFDNFSFEMNNNNRPVGPATNTGRLPLVPLSFRNPVLVRQRDDDFDDDVSIEVARNRVAATPVIQQVISTQTVLPNRLPVPISLRNPILRQSDDDFDDVSLEIVNRDRLVLTTPVRQQVVQTQTVTNRLPAVPVGFRSQLVRESDGDLSVEILRDNTVATPNQQTVPASTQPGNQVSNVRTPVLFTRQSDERDDDISVELFGSIVNQNVRLPTAVVPVQTSAIRPVQQANNRQQPIQTFTQVNNVPSRPVTARPQVQPARTSTTNQQPSVASSDRLPLVPMSFRNPILVRERDDDFDDDISIEIRERVVVSQPVVRPTVQPVSQPVVQSVVQPVVRPIAQPVVRPAVQPVAQPVVQSIVQPVVRPAVQPVVQSVVQPVVRPIPQPAVRPVAQPIAQPVVQPVVRPVVSTQTSTVLSGRLPVPIGFRNQILRQSDEIDDVSIEIRDRNVFTQQVNQINGQVQTSPITTDNKAEFVITQDFDGDVSVELVSRPQSQQSLDNQSVQQGFSITPVRPIVPPQPVVVSSSFAQTGNEGQQLNQQQQQQQLNVFDDYSLEDNDDDDDDFFLEDQFDNVDGFRLLASDFFNPPSGGGFPSVRSVEDHEEKSVEPVVSLDDSDFHVAAESDDWFLVKQYMDHDYSSEELEGELAKEYFWHPVKDSSNKKVKTDQDKMAELKPARS